MVVLWNMLLKLYIVMLLIAGCVTNVCALDTSQIKVMMYAHSYGDTLLYKNQGFGDTIASIVFQETKAGYHKYVKSGVIVGDKNKFGKPKSLGVMQVQLPAARDVERWFPSIIKSHFNNRIPTDEELIIELLTDYKFNIRVGSWYYVKMLQLSKNWRKSILAYNRGLHNDGKDPNDYVRKVLHWRSQLGKWGIIN